MRDPLLDPRVPWLAERARRDPGGEAIAWGEERLSFADLAARAGRIAAGLAARGVGRGDRVVLLCESSLRMVEALHGVAWVGATAVLPSPRLTDAERAPLVERVTPATILGEEDLQALGSGDGSPPTPCAVEPDLVHTILFTSGTTGTPKGAMLAHGNHFASAHASRSRLGSRPEDRWLLTLPLHHVGGLSVLVRSLVDGVPVVLQRGFDADLVNRAIREQGVTLVSLVATTLRRLLDASGGRPFPPTLRAALVGGGPVPATIVERALALGVPVLPTYGLTETASQVATASSDLARRKPGCVGRALPGTEVRIESADAEGRGEVLVRGPTVMRGYLDDPVATARALRSGWLATGDVGRIDDDGDLWIEDRRSDLIVSGGENVYPAEVEAALVAHPDVLEAAVYGEPDEEWGARVAAALVARDGRVLSLDAVREHCAGRIARFKIPRVVRFVDSLPRTAAGKVQRHRLRREVGDRAG